MIFIFHLILTWAISHDKNHLHGLQILDRENLHDGALCQDPALFFIMPGVKFQLQKYIKFLNKIFPLDQRGL